MTTVVPLCILCNADMAQPCVIAKALNPITTLSTSRVLCEAASVFSDAVRLCNVPRLYQPIMHSSSSELMVRSGTRVDCNQALCSAAVISSSSLPHGTGSTRSTAWLLNTDRHCLRDHREFASGRSINQGQGGMDGHSQCLLQTRKVKLSANAWQCSAWRHLWSLEGSEPASSTSGVDALLRCTPRLMVKLI